MEEQETSRHVFEMTVGNGKKKRFLEVRINLFSGRLSTGF